MRVLYRVAMRLGPVLCGAIWRVVVAVWSVGRIAVLVDVWGRVALLDMVWLHDMVLRRIASQD